MSNVLAVPIVLTQPASPPPWLDEVAQRVDVYGRLDGHLAFSENDVQFANNSSRLAFMAEQRLPSGVSVLGQGE
ncbi:MAG TPA: hypothetical protein VFU02_04355 [Polyangiaceae bacterium]|nr:hypothetical protein [Polyangiaceae bacterium]